MILSKSLIFYDVILYFCKIMCDQKSQKQLFSPRRRCLNLLFRQQ